MKMSEETVTIKKSVYMKLKEDQKILDALYAAGVDNWEGYQDDYTPTLTILNSLFALVLT
jgi:hypothetical protein